MKVIWLDTETTGADPVVNGLIEVALIAEIEGEVLSKKVWNMNVYPDDVITDDALAINGRTREEIASFPDPKGVYEEILALLALHCDKFDRSDKMFIGGYNGKFDLDFLNQFFIKSGDKYFGSFFNWRVLDPLQIINILEYKGVLAGLPDRKLGTVAERLGIDPGKSHTALDDVETARAIFLRLIKNMYFNKEKN